MRAEEQKYQRQQREKTQMTKVEQHIFRQSNFDKKDEENSDECQKCRGLYDKMIKRRYGLVVAKKRKKEKVRNQSVKLKRERQLWTLVSLNAH